MNNISLLIFVYLSCQECLAGALNIPDPAKNYQSHRLKRLIIIIECFQYSLQ